MGSGVLGLMTLTAPSLVVMVPSNKAAPVTVPHPTVMVMTVQARGQELCRVIEDTVQVSRNKASVIEASFRARQIL